VFAPRDFMECGGKAQRDTALDGCAQFLTARNPKRRRRFALPAHSKTIEGTYADNRTRGLWRDGL